MKEIKDQDEKEKRTTDIFYMVDKIVHQRNRKKHQISTKVSHKTK